MMKLTRLASLYLLLPPLLLLRWPTLAVAKTLLRSSTSSHIDQVHPISSSSPQGREDHHNDEYIQDDGEITSITTMERGLQQSRNCLNVTQWDETIVLEVDYTLSRCFEQITDSRVYTNTDQLFRTASVMKIVQDLQTNYVLTYNWMQGQSKKLGDYCMHCDPFARRVNGASITKVSRRFNSSILAFEMKITYTSRGWTTMTDLSAFDVPSLIQKDPAVGNCACKTVGTNLTRAPHEAEFNVLYQQVVQSFDSGCFQNPSSCSYGTPWIWRLRSILMDHR